MRLPIYDFFVSVIHSTIFVVSAWVDGFVAPPPFELRLKLEVALPTLYLVPRWCLFAQGAVCAYPRFFLIFATLATSHKQTAHGYPWGTGVCCYYLYETRCWFTMHVQKFFFGPLWETSRLFFNKFFLSTISISSVMILLLLCFATTLLSFDQRQEVCVPFDAHALSRTLP